MWVLDEVSNYIFKTKVGLNFGFSSDMLLSNIVMVTVGIFSEESSVQGGSFLAHFQIRMPV